MTDFNLKDFLTENKLTALSRLTSEEIRSTDLSMMNEPEIKKWYDGLPDNDREKLDKLVQVYEDTKEADELASFLHDYRFDLFYPLTDDAEFFIEDESIEEFIDTYDDITSMLEGVEKKTISEMSREEILELIGMEVDEAEYLSTEELQELAEGIDVTNEEVSEDTVEEQPTSTSSYLKMEGPDAIIKELEKEISRVTLEAKMKRLKEIVEAFDTKINSLEEDSDLAGFVSTSKLKEMKRTVKKLRSMNEKYVKEYDKKYNKQ